jgi:hypothetical protein
MHVFISVALSPKHLCDFGTPGNGPLLLGYAANFVFVQGYSGSASVLLQGKKAVSDRD